MRTAAAGAVTPFHARRAVLFFSKRERLQLCLRGDRGRVSANGSSLAAEGPSCLFVGPLETASKERLEALYQQARESYYSGKPLIVDDMFDKVELKLRLYGSKSVVKYPRCSLKRQLTYADAEEDPSQTLALAGVWFLLFVTGASALLLPTFYTITLALEDTIHQLDSGRSHFEVLTTVNKVLLVGLGYLVGYPVASASVQALERLWRKDLVGLKGSCPNCGNEVFAFLRPGSSIQQPYRSECHVCECTLEFRAKVEHPISSPGRRWVYGRVYLVRGSFPESPRQM